MRRIWAYVVLCLSCLLIMGVTITPIVGKADADLEYQDGREIVYRVADRDDYTLAVDPDAVEDVAETMDERLQTAEIDSYEIVIQGDDTIKVTFSASYSADYDNIKEYLSYNGTFALGLMNDQELKIGNEWRSDDEVYLKTINGYPAICIPVKRGTGAFDQVLEGAYTQIADGIGEESYEETEDEDEEPEVIITTYMYLWGNYIEGVDSWDKTVEDSATYDADVAAKILMKFDVTNGGFFLDNDEDEDVIVQYINIDTDGNGISSVAEREAGYSTARYLVNLLNTSSYDYDVVFLYDTITDATVDTIVSLGEHATIAWSETLIATLVALVLVTIALAFVYRLLSTTAFMMTSISLFGGVAISVALSVEFNVAAIVGVLLLMLASVISCVMYFNKFKEECYKGRSLKKANADASKRSLWPIFDINLVLIIIGACAYLLGGSYMAAFASITVIGGVVSMLANIFLLKGAMNLLTNNQKWAGRYELFGVNREQIPDTTQGEKQTYYGPNSDRSYTKHPKMMTTICGVFFIAALAGMITFGVVADDHNMFNSKTETPESQIYFETTAETTAINNDSIHKFLDKIYLGEYEYDVDPTSFASESEMRLYFAENFMTLEDYTYEISDYTQSIKVNEDYVDYYFFVVSLDSTDINTESSAFYIGSLETAEADITETNGLVINDVILYASEQSTSGIIDSKATITLKDGVVVSTYTPDLYPIILATAVGLAVSAVYLMFRYRPSRGIAVLCTTTVAGAVTVGIFALIRAVVTPTLILALPFTVAFTFFISIFQMNKEREMIADSKKRELLLEDRHEIMDKSTSYSFGVLMFCLVVLVLGAFCFFGFGPSASYTVYLAIIIGGLIATFVTITCLGPWSHAIYKWMRAHRINRRPKKNKKPKKPAPKSSEPEEAIFIGIND